MNQKLQVVWRRVRTVADGFTPGQKAITAIAVVVAVVGAIFFASWAGKPQMAPLYTGLASADAAAVTQKLTETGTAYELADGGQTVLVAQDKVNGERLNMAAAGLPSGGDKGEGYNLLSGQSLTTSDFQQRMTAKRAYEGEIRKTIETIDGVQSARVMLALPDNSVFAEEKAKPTASVQVKLGPGKALTASQVEAVVHLVSTSVADLDANAVTVTDATGKLLSSPGGAGGAAGTGDARVAQMQTYSAAIAQKVQAMLDKVVGPGNSSVSAQAELDYDNTTIERNEYLQGQPTDKPVRSESLTEKMDGAGGTPVGGVLGPDNITVPNGQAQAGKQSYTKTQSKVDNAVGTQKTNRVAAQGGLKRMTVAAVLDAKAAGRINQQEITNLISAAAGIDTKRGDVVQVSKMAFDTQSAQAAQAAAKADEEAAFRSQLIDIGKNVGLALLLLLALIIGFAKSRRTVEEYELGELESAPQMPELPQLTAAPMPGVYDDGHTLPVLEAVPVDPQSEARLQARQEVTALVDEDPEEVARLLRGWIGERS